MAMPSAAETLMTLDEFLAWEREQPERYEFADGVVTMMTGGSAAHVTIRGRKRFDYFATPSVRQYAIVEQDERLVDLYTRTDAGWINEIITGEAVLNLSSIGVALSLDTIYEDADLDPTRRPAGGEPAPAA